MPLWLQILLAVAVLYQPLTSIASSLAPKVLPVAKGAAGRVAGFIGPQWARIAGGFAVGVVATLLVIAAVGALPSIKWPTIPWPLPNIVTPSGPRRVMVVYESKGAPAQFKGELVSLRKDADAGYLKSKGHVLDLLDLDAKGPDDSPSPRVIEFKTNFANLTPPALLVISPPNKVLSAEAIPATVKAADLIEKVKAHE